MPKKRRYGKYPEQKTENHGLRRPAKYYRINPRVRYLKPMKRTTKAKGKEYIHYVIATTVPEEWKSGVKVTIEPTKGLVKALRQSERDLNEEGPDFRQMLERHLASEAERDERDDKELEEWRRSSISESVKKPKKKELKMTDLFEEFEDAEENEEKKS